MPNRTDETFCRLKFGIRNGHRYYTSHYLRLKVPMVLSKIEIYTNRAAGNS